MPRCLIIGYGNPLRGDDRLGWRVNELLAELPEIARNPSVELITCHQLTPELADPISQAELVIFIDAASEGAPGTVKSELLAAGKAQPDALGHHFTPGRTLAYARAIFGGNPRAVVVSVAAASFELGERLSPEVEQALPEVVARVRELAAKLQ